MVCSRRTLPQVFEELAKVARGHGAILVRRAVIDEQRAADDDRAARETAAAIEPIELVVRLRLHQPVGRAMPHEARIVEVQQQRAEAVVFVRADGVVEREPPVRRLDGRRVDAELEDFPRASTPANFDTP